MSARLIRLGVTVEEKRRERTDADGAAAGDAELAATAEEAAASGAVAA